MRSSGICVSIGIGTGLALFAGRHHVDANKKEHDKRNEIFHARDLTSQNRNIHEVGSRGILTRNNTH